MNFKIFFLRLFPFIHWFLKSTKNYWVLVPNSNILFPKSLMVLYFDIFKLKLFHFIDFMGWNIKGYTTSGCKDIDIETSEFVRIDLNSFLVCCFIQCYFQGMKLYSVDFYHNKWVIFNLFLIAMVFFQISDVFPYKCTCLTFLLVRRLYQYDVCKSDICTVWPLKRPMFMGPTFVRGREPPDAMSLRNADTSLPDLLGRPSLQYADQASAMQ